MDVSTGEAGTTTLSVIVVPCKLYYKKSFLYSLTQGCPILLLHGHFPAEFSYNQLQHTGLEVSSDPEELGELVQV